MFFYFNRILIMGASTANPLELMRYPPESHLEMDLFFCVNKVSLFGGKR
jgi:hypothetical protein